MDKLIEFINSFKNPNLKEIVFRGLNLLPFLIGILALVLFLKLIINLKSKRRTNLGVSSLAFFKKKNLFLRHLPEILFVFSVLFLIASLLNPVLPLIKNKKKIEAKEIMIVLDFSGSMTMSWETYGGNIPQDQKSLTKLHVELKYVAKFIETRENDGLGIIVYSDNPYLTSPFNHYDHQSLISLIQLFGVGVTTSTNTVIPDEGSTATGEALYLANDYLKEYAQGKEIIIVLFTDGECNRGRPAEGAFEEIRKSGYKVFTLGISYDKNEKTAQMLAEQAIQTGGGFFPIDTEEDLKKAVYTVDKLVGKNKILIEEYTVDDPQYFYFAFVSLVLFIFALLLKHLHYFRDLL